MSTKSNKTNKRRKNLNYPVAVVHINATFNNTIVSVTDQDGNVLVASSAGANNFKGSKKSTPYAAQTTVAAALEKATSYGIKTVSVRVKGPGLGRDAAIRQVHAKGWNITDIHDVTGVPHGGCRPRKRRRV